MEQAQKQGRGIKYSSIQLVLTTKFYIYMLVAACAVCYSSSTLLLISPFFFPPFLCMIIWMLPILSLKKRDKNSSTRWQPSATFTIIWKRSMDACTALMKPMSLANSSHGAFSVKKRLSGTQNYFKTTKSFMYKETR